MALSMFGAFELALPSGLQQRLSTRRRQGLRRRLRHGARRRHHRRALHRPGAGVDPRLRRDDASRSLLGGSLLVTYALGMGVLFFAIAAFAVALPKSGAWMEAVKSVFGDRHARGRALLPAQRGCRRSPRSAAPSPAWLVGSLGARRRRRRRSARSTCRSTTPPCARARRSASPSSSCGLFGAVAGVLAPAPRQRRAGARLGARRGRGAQAGARAASAGAARLLRRLVPAVQRAGAEDLQPRRSGRARSARFTLVKVDCTTDDDPAVAAAKQRWQARPRCRRSCSSTPTARWRARIDHFVEPQELLKLLEDAS